MSLKSNVKINAVNNLSDARYSAGMGVNLLGFCLDEHHPKFVNMAKLGALANWVSGVQLVFEFNNFNTEIFEQARQVAVPHFVQVFDVSNWDLLEKTSLPIIHKINFDPRECDLTIALTSSPANYILLESNADFSLEIYAEELKALSSVKHICLGWGITKENIENIMNDVSPWAIAIEGGEEERPGIKTFEEMAEILELLEEEL